MNITVKDILGLAEKIIPIIVPGSAFAVEAAKAVTDLIDKAKATATETDAAKLDAYRIELEERAEQSVNDASTILRGGKPE